MKAIDFLEKIIDLGWLSERIEISNNFHTAGSAVEYAKIMGCDSANINPSRKDTYSKKARYAILTILEYEKEDLMDLISQADICGHYTNRGIKELMYFFKLY